VQVWGYIVSDFSTRVQSYFDLRSRLEKGLPPVRVTTDVAEIRRAQRALAREIQAARHGAHEGDIFSPVISAEFREVLAREMNADTWAVIMDDNPGEFSHEINGIYPDGTPYSAVPVNILAALPALPDDVEYRFLGRHLILLDARANVILDEIACAIRRVDCDPADRVNSRTRSGRQDLAWCEQGPIDVCHDSTRSPARTSLRVGPDAGNAGSPLAQDLLNVHRLTHRKDVGT
jgi:hypothetical protein